MNRKLGLVLTVLLALALTACKTAGTDVVVDDNANTSKNVEVDPNANNAFNTGYSLSELAALGINGNPLNYTTVYFQYNSSAIDQRSRIIAEAHARELNGRGGARVNLEGHADERGTRDYNLALGERRAQTVAQLMNAAGANSSIQTISYGEERPADAAHNESAWQANRRVEIKY